MSTQSTHQNCIVCGNTSFETKLHCTDHFVSGEKFDIEECTECGFKRTKDFPEAFKIAPYYKSEEYISHSNTQKGVINKIYHKVRDIMLNRKFKLIEQKTTGKKLLDIGCGIGYFPYFMKQKGYEAHGMELDSDARKFALDNFDLEVYSPDEILLTKQTNEYHVITLWHVLEHLHDINRYMNWIKDSLKQGGVLLIALPNCNSGDAAKYKEFWAAYDVPRHLWHFEPKTFKPFAEKYGFELKEIKRLPFDAYYNSMLSAKYAKKTPAILYGAISGFLSNTKSKSKPDKCSSVIYVLKHLA